MRGLHLDYEAYVETKKPKDLDKALKFAQIYDDIGRRLKGSFGKGKEKGKFSMKRRFFCKTPRKIDGVCLSSHPYIALSFQI